MHEKNLQWLKVQCFFIYFFKKWYSTVLYFCIISWLVKLYCYQIVNAFVQVYDVTLFSGVFQGSTAVLFITSICVYCIFFLCYTPPFLPLLHPTVEPAYCGHFHGLVYGAWYTLHLKRNIIGWTEIKGIGHLNCLVLTHPLILQNKDSIQYSLRQKCKTTV